MCGWGGVRSGGGLAGVHGGRVRGGGKGGFTLAGNHRCFYGGGIQLQRECLESRNGFSEPGGFQGPQGTWTQGTRRGGKIAPAVGRDSRRIGDSLQSAGRARTRTVRRFYV